MTQITIEPVTRIEGHASVVCDLDAEGTLLDARLIVNELRGFERLLVGMQADRMPLITARICGVCPSAHHLAAVHALEHLTATPPPKAARLLRELLYMGHIIHSHTLSLFVLQGPDLVFGFSAPAEKRNIVGVLAAEPDLARKALRLRSLGQKINELVGGRGVHPVTAVPGGTTFALDQERYRRLGDWSRESLELAQWLVPAARDYLLRLIDKHPRLAADWHVPTCQLATIEDGALNFCSGPLQIRDENAEILDQFAVQDYEHHFIEVTRKDCYLKPVFAKVDGLERLCRVGPLARINCADRIGTPAADKELEVFRAAWPRPCHGTVMQTWARAIELLYATERALEILNDQSIFDRARVPVSLREGRAVGHIEAPRGTLVHDYQVDDHGIIVSANLIVATQFNYAAINRSLVQAIGDTVQTAPDAQVLDAAEFSIRCYDPCLSCATHAFGQMPLDVVFRQDSKVVRTARRRP